MKTNIVKDISYKFAVDIVMVCKDLTSKKEFVLSKQLLRSGTAIGALIRESEYGESTKDFIHKLAMALKEANETEYWLDLLNSTQHINNEVYHKLVGVNKSILRLLISSIKTLKQKS